MSFTATVHQNEYVPEGSGEVHAIVTVEAGADVQAAAAMERNLILICDTSGSMSNPMSKIMAARQAMAAAVNEIPDGVRFALIAGDHEAEVIFPTNGHDPLPADATTRAAAAGLALQLEPSGGTAISTWLAAARELFQGHEGMNLAYLLTDGKNESEPESNLVEELVRCSGLFQCDTRGVGDAWVVEELRRISHALLGEVDIVREPEAMAEDFQAFLKRALGKAVANVSLNVWAPVGSTIKFVKQVAPNIEDLSDRGADAGKLTTAFPTGAWSGGESRDYHVCVTVPPGAVGEEKLAARVRLNVDGEDVSNGLVRAIWTDDTALTTRIDPQVAHYTGQAELAQAIQEGLAARKAGDEATATVKLGKAVKLAHESGNDGTVRLLKKVVEVEDPNTGTVRLKKNVEKLDEMELDTRSTRTVRVSAKGS